MQSTILKQFYINLFTLSISLSQNQLLKGFTNSNFE